MTGWRASSLGRKIFAASLVPSRVGIITLASNWKGASCADAETTAMSTRPRQLILHRAEHDEAWAGRECMLGLITWGWRRGQLCERGLVPAAAKPPRAAFMWSDFLPQRSLRDT